ncbi:Cytochrome P450 [Neofusicoccum parvum]|uniref:Putative cytochrome p450 protein n=1 Tax=Botryosphaeria parva (strain UCR-NP2) TaxID=1287680 RepID=R1EXU5_BOTPV|nr:putative cytochrome p450 protein [Neofusicoccum parvum UCRNP2]GME43245.1 Cytochrome P450 [Neofusicoccum parvum]
MAFLTLLTAFGIVGLLALIKVAFFTAKPKIPKGLKPLPGPKGYPVLGSVPDVPEQNSYIKFYEWSKEYGPIYQVDLAGSNHVWISTDAIARDLLSKKKYLPLMSKNPHWSRQRKVATYIMRESKLNTFYNYPELESIRLLKELIEEPHKYNHALESFISRVTCRLAWGHAEGSDELKQRARELLISVSPTGHLANKIPFVMSLPDWLSPVKAWERKRQRTERRWFEIMQNQVKQDMAEKRAAPSWMQTLQNTWDKWDFSYDLEGAFCVGMHGIAGALTIAAPMQTFCLAMCHYPQYLPILHEELDRVCGDRLPRADDRPNLPVLRAFIREVMRWRPPVPTGIPHFLIQDDEYNGYHIPAGSVMHPLEWAIARDPELFPDPDTFNPMRWLDSSYPSYREPLTEHPSIINITQFGYGRRLCQGQQVADEDLFIGLGALAWLFDIRKTGSAPTAAAEKTPTSPIGTAYGTNEKASISSEELSTGVYASGVDAARNDSVIGTAQGSPRLRPGDDAVVATSTEYAAAAAAEQTAAAEAAETLLSPVAAEKAPGAWPIRGADAVAHEAWEKEQEQKSFVEKAVKKAKQAVDPTLDYTHLLIAKPKPFEFQLTVREGMGRRRELVERLFEEKKREGEFPEGKNYWGDGKGEFGWVKV